MKKVFGHLLRSAPWQAILLAVVAVVGVTVFQRAHRVVDVTSDWIEDLRYQLESGGTVGAAPASETFAGEYLDAIFGGNPDLLAKLKAVISKGLVDDPTLNLGEVAAMVVSYRVSADNKVEDVVATVIGGFPLGKRKPGFNRTGWFSQYAESDMYDTGNSVISMLGRDLIHFAEPQVEKTHTEMFESVMRGDILPLARSLTRAYHFTAVFPEPRRLLPPQLRQHVQALIINGDLEQAKGSYETILLCHSPEAAAVNVSLVEDLRTATGIMMRNRMGGATKQKPWGAQAGTWWAAELAQSLESGSFQNEDKVIRFKSSFQRVMVNATLKGLERMGRDLRQMRGVLDERLSPEVVDGGTPMKRWTDEHEWGPDWPIPPGLLMTNAPAQPTTARL